MSAVAEPHAAVDIETEADATRLKFSGRLDAEGVTALWPKVMAAVRSLGRDRKLVLDLDAVSRCDTAGATFLVAAEAAHGGAELRGGSDAVHAIIERVRDVRPTERSEPTPPPGLTQIMADGVRAALDGVAFVGEAAIARVRMPMRRRMLRIPDLLRYADQAGVRSQPLIVLMGFLIGMILAFQTAVAMQTYGATIYVVNVVSISLLRELGPLLAANILAGRTGSAYAAEIGTMKVNEEVSALTTMGIDPVTMLVLPRLAAAMLVMPAMALVFEIAGLIGMAFVMNTLGYTPQQVVSQFKYAAQLKDLLGGMVKATVFGLAIAAIGCRAGLSAGVGARGVGHSTTSAVVGGIVATIVIDGIFAVTFYVTGY